MQQVDPKEEQSCKKRIRLTCPVCGHKWLKRTFKEIQRDDGLLDEDDPDFLIIN